MYALRGQVVVIQLHAQNVNKVQFALSASLIIHSIKRTIFVNLMIRVTMTHSVMLAQKINAHLVPMATCSLPSQNLVKNAQIIVMFVIRIWYALHALSNISFPMEVVQIALQIATNVRMPKFVSSASLDIHPINMVAVIHVLVIVNIVKVKILVKSVLQDFFWISKQNYVKLVKCHVLSAQVLALTVRNVR